MNLSEGKKIGHALLPKGTSGIARYDRDQEIIHAGEKIKLDANLIVVFRDLPLILSSAFWVGVSDSPLSD